jgi:hypothetical protein
VGVAAMFAVGALNAASFQNEQVSIPFAFHVNKASLPAGDYRLQQPMGNDIVYLMNMKTGEKVQFLRSNGNRKEGRARLVFENTESGYSLKSIS